PASARPAVGQTQTRWRRRTPCSFGCNGRSSGRKRGQMRCAATNPREPCRRLFLARPASGMRTYSRYADNNFAKMRSRRHVPVVRLRLIEGEYLIESTSDCGRTDMRLEDHFESNSTLQRNERVKLAASFWNNVGAGMVIGGMAGAFFLDKPPGAWTKI